MEEEKIVLDKKSFEALAGETRVKILKSLIQRQKTSTELAQEFSLAVPSIKEHLDTLESAGFVEKLDDGHKWKYYRLTKKGKTLFSPNEFRIMILLGISSLASLLSTFVLFVKSPEPEAVAISSFSKAAPESDLMLSAAASVPLESTSNSFLDESILGIVLMISILCVVLCSCILILNRLDLRKNKS